jgi:hypothetical protein
MGESGIGISPIKALSMMTETEINNNKGKQLP